MAVAATLQKQGNGRPAIQIDPSSGLATLYFTLAFTGNYPGAPGDTLDLTKMVLPPGFTLPLGKVIQGWAQSANPAGASGFLYLINAAGGFPAALNALTVEVQASGGSGNPHGDISTTAYPAGVTGDTVQGCVVCQIGS